MSEQTAHLITKENLKDNNVVYFKNLDVLRFFAAIMIIIAHGYEGWIGWMGLPEIFRANPENMYASNLLGTFINQIIANCIFGVDIFFLISGFLITYLLLKEKEKYGSISIKKFMMRRGLRIWPLYYLIVITAPFLVQLCNYNKVHGMAVTPDPNYLKNYFFLGNFDIISTGKWMFPFAHFWSICIEEHFYFVWPFIMAFVPKRHLIKACIIIISASILSRGYYFTVGNSDSYLQIYVNTLCRIDVIIIGAIFAYIHHRRPFVLNTPKFMRILLLIGFIGIMGVAPIYGDNSLFQVLVVKYLYIAWIGFLMLNFIFNPQPLFAFNKKGVFHYLGKISFGIYMYNNILLAFITDNVLARNGNVVTLVGYFLIYIAGTILIASISWELFEKQILKFKTRFEIIPTKR